MNPLVCTIFATLLGIVVAVVVVAIALRGAPGNREARDSATGDDFQRGSIPGAPGATFSRISAVVVGSFIGLRAIR